MAGPSQAPEPHDDDDQARSQDQHSGSSKGLPVKGAVPKASIDVLICSDVVQLPGYEPQQWRGRPENIQVMVWHPVVI